MTTIGIVLVALLGAAIAVFALQNAAPMPIRFLGWTLDSVPVAAVILISLAAGLVIVGVPLWIQRWRLRARARALDRRIAELERQVAELERARPAASPPNERAAS